MYKWVEHRGLKMAELHTQGLRYEFSMNHFPLPAVWVKIFWLYDIPDTHTNSCQPLTCYT